MASFDKAQIKIVTATNIGASVEDMLEAATADTNRCEGARSALSQAAKNVLALHEHVDRDVKEQMMDLPTSEIVKRYITRAVGILDNLATASEAQRIQTTGRAEGLRRAMGVVKKVVDEETVKAATAKNDDTVDAPDMSAADEIAQRRLVARRKRVKRAADA